MLFALEGEWTLGKTLPVQLELARLLAPMVSIARGTDCHYPGNLGTANKFSHSPLA